MFEKILVAIDEREMNEKVLNAALGVANYKATEVTLVHVNKTTVTAAFPYVSKELMEGTIEEMEKASQKILDDAEQRLRQQASENVRIKKVNLQGDPALQILGHAKEYGHNMIIIGSRGLDGLKGLMLGSVSYKVSQLSECPVLIVH